MIVVAGPRQIGKTTMVKQALSMHASTFVAADQAAPEAINPFSEQANEFMTQALPGSAPTAEWLVLQWTKARAKARAQTDGKCHVLAIDEIQKIPRWSELVKGLWDADRAENLSLHVLSLIHI